MKSILKTLAFAFAISAWVLEVSGHISFFEARAPRHESQFTIRNSAIRFTLYNTTAIVFDGIDSPAALTALAQYSRREPVGSFFRTISLFIAEAI